MFFNRPSAELQQSFKYWDWAGLGFNLFSSTEAVIGTSSTKITYTGDETVLVEKNRFLTGLLPPDWILNVVRWWRVNKSNITAYTAALTFTLSKLVTQCNTPMVSNHLFRCTLKILVNWQVLLMKGEHPPMDVKKSSLDINSWGVCISCSKVRSYTICSGQLFISKVPTYNLSLKKLIRPCTAYLYIKLPAVSLKIFKISHWFPEWYMLQIKFEYICGAHVFKCSVQGQD